MAVKNGDAPRNNPEFVQGLERGFIVIRAFSAEAPALTIAEVASRTKLTRAVARRYLLTLCELGYLVHRGALFSPTPRLLDLGFTYLATLSVTDLAQPFIERVVEALHESCSMAVLDDRDVVYVARVPARRILSANLVVGSRLPAHATAMGQILLAHLPPAELDAFFAGREPERFTKYTITDEGRLRRRLQEVRQRGWASADQEYVVGLRTIAAPVFDRTNRVVAAVNVAGAVAVVTMQGMVRSHLPVLLDATYGLSRALGANVARTLPPGRPRRPARRR